MHSNCQTPITKWVDIEGRSADRITRRLCHLAFHPPSGVPRIRSYGLGSDSRLRIELERVPGRSLHSCLGQLSHQDRCELARRLSRQLAIWRGEGFVHGDLSLRNILIERQPHGPLKRVWFIDFIFDLESRQGTPQFASPDVAKGVHSHDSDRYSIEQILCIVFPMRAHR